MPSKKQPEDFSELDKFAENHIPKGVCLTCVSKDLSLINYGLRKHPVPTVAEFLIKRGFKIEGRTVKRSLGILRDRLRRHKTECLGVAE